MGPWLLLAVGCALDVDFSLLGPQPCEETGVAAPLFAEPETLSEGAAGTVFVGGPAISRLAVDLERGSLEVVVSPGLLFPVLNFAPDDPQDTGTLLTFVEPADDTLAIAARCPADCAEVTFVVELPGPVDTVEARTGDGDLFVEDAATGLVNLEAEGNVTVNGSPARLRAATGSGDVRLDVPDGAFVDVLSGGLADLQGSVRGAVCARAADGLDVALERAGAVTLGGDSDVELRLDAPADRVSVDAARDARLVLPGGRYALTTSVGSDHTATIDPAIEDDPASDRAIAVTTLDGDVSVELAEGAP